VCGVCYLSVDLLFGPLCSFRCFLLCHVALSAVIAWIGQQVHNLFLTYLIVSCFLLFPGLNKHGVISKYAGMAKREVNKLLKQKEKKNE
uniref:ADP-ribosylation factor-like protein 6-interacting protein 1 n=1 Tax=Ailuropoda melanoleuca TaxID=9646 RepID=A0A7N5K641_AILME